MTHCKLPKLGIGFKSLLVGVFVYGMAMEYIVMALNLKLATRSLFTNFIVYNHSQFLQFYQFNEVLAHCTIIVFLCLGIILYMLLGVVT